MNGARTVPLFRGDDAGLVDFDHDPGTLIVFIYRDEAEGAWRGVERHIMQNIMLRLYVDSMHEAGEALVASGLIDSDDAIDRAVVHAMSQAHLRAMMSGVNLVEAAWKELPAEWRAPLGGEIPDSESMYDDLTTYFGVYLEGFIEGVHERVNA